MKGYVRTRLKWEAKRRLGEHFSTCILLTLLSAAVSLVAGNVTGRFLPAVPLNEAELAAFLQNPVAPYLRMSPPQVAGWVLSSALVMILRSPFLVGVSWMFLAITRQETLNWKGILLFYAGPGRWSRALLTELLRTLLETLCFLPGLVLVVLTYYLPLAEGALLVFQLLGLLAAAGGFVFSGAYAQTRYLLAEYPEMRPREVIAHSVAHMKGRLWELAVFRLSFLPWVLLLVATALVGALYVAPYYNLCFALYVRRTWSDAPTSVKAA